MVLAKIRKFVRLFFLRLYLGFLGGKTISSLFVEKERLSRLETRQAWFLLFLVSIVWQYGYFRSVWWWLNSTQISREEPESLPSDVSKTSIWFFSLSKIRLYSRLFNYLVTQEEVQKYTSELWSLIASEKLKINIHKEYPFTEEGIRATHDDIVGRSTVGKLLAKIVWDHEVKRDEIWKQDSQEYM